MQRVKPLCLNCRNTQEGRQWRATKSIVEKLIPQEKEVVEKIEELSPLAALGVDVDSPKPEEKKVEEEDQPQLLSLLRDLGM
jgi:hypothetical protein